MNKLLNKILSSIIKQKFLTIIICTVITLCFAVAIPFLNIKADVESLIPDLEEQKTKLEAYGIPQSDFLIVAVEAENPYTAEGLKALDTAINQTLRYEGVDGVISPFNQISFGNKPRKKGFSVEIFPVAPNQIVPQNPRDIKIFKERLLSSPFAKRLVTSEDGKTLLVYFSYTQIDDYSLFMEYVEKTFQPVEEFFTVYTTGFPPFENEAKDFLVRDITLLLGLGIILVLIVYYIGFRSIRAVLLPVSVILMGTIWTLGLMSLLKLPVTVVSIVTPPLVLALGSSYCIHVLNQYFRNAHDQKDTHNKEDETTSIAQSVSHVSRTIFLASGTTIIGFLSLLVTSLTQTRQFAIATSFGIMACAILSITYLPAMLSLIRPPSKKQKDNVKKGLITRTINKFSGPILKGRILFLILLIIITGGFFLSTGNIAHQTDYITYFPEKSKTVQDNRVITKVTGGISQIYIVFTAPENEKKYFLKTKNLQQIEKVEEVLRNNLDIAYLLSFNSYIREVNYLKTGKKEIPPGLPRLVGNILSGYSDKTGDTSILSRVANKDFSQINIMINFYDHETGLTLPEGKITELISSIKDVVEKEVDPAVESNIMGTWVQYIELYKIMNQDLLKSTLLALIIIFLLTSFAFRSFKYGILSVIPMLTGIMLNFIFMVITHISLDMTTIMVSCVAIGIGVDDSIHFLLQYRTLDKIRVKENQGKNLDKEQEKKSIRQTIQLTMEITGRPIILTSLSIILGLMMLVFSRFVPIGYFGILVALALFTTTIGCLVFLPSLLSFSLFRPNTKLKEKNLKKKI